MFYDTHVIFLCSHTLGFWPTGKCIIGKEQQQKESKLKSKAQHLPSQFLGQMAYNSRRFRGNFESFTNTVEVKIKKKFV